MDRGGWLKYSNQFSTVYGASTISNQINVLNGNDSHFYDRTLRYMEDQNIQPFPLKSGNSVNDQPNDNAKNVKLKYN